MQITNRLGLSDCWVNAVRADIAAYDRVGWLSATDLVSPVQQVHLRKRHDEEITEDVTDRLWALLGSACHTILELGADENALTEMRFRVPILGRDISMKPDRIEPIPNTNPQEFYLKDFKISTVWTYIFDDKLEWVMKTNFYAYGLNAIGINVTKAAHEMLFKDWSHRNLVEAKRREQRYPEEKVAVMPVEIWPMETTKGMLEKRVLAHEAAFKLADDELPECTEEERWHRGDKFKVWKKGAKQAYRNFDNRPEAEEFRKTVAKPSEYDIRFFPGKSQRCEDYCPAKPFCHQYRNKIQPMKKG